MSKRLWRCAVLALLAIPGGAAAADQPLFIIERSKNANVVHYDARLTADGQWDVAQPVSAYWILLAGDKSRQDLSWIEKKMAYGFALKPDPAAGGYTMKMVASPDRPITLRLEQAAVRAEIVIDGHVSVLEKMYINSTEGLTGPKVKYIELHGKDLQTAEQRFEKITPK